MSSDRLEVAGLVADPGQRVADHVTVRVAGLEVQLPIFLIHGAYPGPTLAVTAGIHGAEYASIEAALRLGRTLDPATLHGQVVIAPIANPPMFKMRGIYVSPPDGKNLNRQFPGLAHGTFSQALAYWLFNEIIRPSDAYVDLHGGDLIEALVPFVIHFAAGDATVDQASAAMAQCFGIRYVLQSATADATPGTACGAAAQAGIPAILAEAGGQGIWTEETVDLLHTGVRRVMAHLDMADPVPEPAESPVQLQQGWSWLQAKANGLFYPRVKIGDQVHAGQQVGQITDVFGQPLQSVIAPQDGIVLFLVTSLAINAGDPLLAIAA